LQNNNTEFILSSASRKTRWQPGTLRADSITQAFWRAVKKRCITERKPAVLLPGFTSVNTARNLLRNYWGINRWKWRTFILIAAVPSGRRY